MDMKRIDGYQRELQAAVDSVKNKLAECQTIFGVIESFSYLIRKEYESSGIEVIKNGVK